MYKLAFYCLTALVASGWGQEQTRLSCSTAQDCNFIENAICSPAGVCACGPGFQSVQGFTRCLPAAPYYGSPCVEDFQCSRLQFGYQCGADGTCDCQPGLRYFNGRCRAASDFGAACTADEQCIGANDPFSLACIANACTCAPGYYQRQFGECRRITNSPGGFCFLQSDCQFENSFCDVATLTCITQAPESVGTIADEAFKTQVQEVEAPALKKAVEDSVATDETAVGTRLHGATCSDNSDCGAGFECSPQSHCLCPIGYFPSSDGNSCLGELGAPPVNGQCGHIFAEVDPVSGLCRCHNNFVYLSNMRQCLRPNTAFNLFCISDLSCRTFGYAAVCIVTDSVFGFTECDCNVEISSRDDENLVCRLVGVIGDVCEFDQECPNNSVCQEEETGSDKICGCPSGTTLLPAEQICLNDNLELNEDCNLDLECGVENSGCFNGVCACNEGFFASEGVCYPALGGPCSVSADCPMEHSMCENSICTCEDAAVQVNGECHLHSEGLEAECSYDVQCHLAIGTGSVCLEETCQCGEGYHFRNGICRISVGVGSRCASHGQCFLAENLDRSVCRNHQCVCDWDYEYDAATRTCVELSTLSSGSIFGVGFTIIIIPLTVIFFSRIIH